MADKQASKPTSKMVGLLCPWCGRPLTQVPGMPARTGGGREWVPVTCPSLPQHTAMVSETDKDIIITLVKKS